MTDEQFEYIKKTHKTKTKLLVIILIVLLAILAITIVTLITLVMINNRTVEYNEFIRDMLYPKYQWK